MEKGMTDANYAALVDACYSALDSPAGLDRTLTLIGAAIGADAGDLVTEAANGTALRTHASFGFDDSFRHAFDSEFLGRNPWFDQLLLRPRGAFHADGDDLPAYWSSRYFNEWVRPQGFCCSIGAVLEWTPERHTWVGFVRCAGRMPFTDEKPLLDRLLPHLRRVFDTHRRISGQAEGAMMALLQCLPAPVLMTDSRGWLVAYNAEGEAILCDQTLLTRRRDGILAAVASDDGCHLDDRIRRAASWIAPDNCSAEDVVLTAVGGERVAIRLLPLRADGPLSDGPALAVIVQTSTTRKADMGIAERLFGLSPTERALVHWLISGGDLVGFQRIVDSAPGPRVGT